MRYLIVRSKKVRKLKFVFDQLSFFLNNSQLERRIYEVVNVSSIMFTHIQPLHFSHSSAFLQVWLDTRFTRFFMKYVI